MTDETKSHALDIIAQLSEQYLEIEKLAREAMQDYSGAAEIGDMDARWKAFKEMECYMDAHAAVIKAIKILNDARKGIE